MRRVQIEQEQETLHQEHTLGGRNTVRQKVHWDFILTQVVTVSLCPFAIGWDLILQLYPIDRTEKNLCTAN